MTVCVLMTHVYTLKHKKKRIISIPTVSTQFLLFPPTAFKCFLSCKNS